MKICPDGIKGERMRGRCVSMKMTRRHHHCHYHLSYDVIGVAQKIQFSRSCSRMEIEPGPGLSRGCGRVEIEPGPGLRKSVGPGQDWTGESWSWVGSSD